LPGFGCAKPDSLTPPHFANKKTLRLEGENRSAFSTIFRHMGASERGTPTTVIVIHSLWEKAVAVLLGQYMTAYAVWMW